MISTAIALWLLLASEPTNGQSKQTPQTPPPCEATSENQSGGVTACSVVNPRNPHREKLASAMILMSQEGQTVIDTMLNMGGGYTALYDPTDPVFASERDTTKMYIIFAGKSGIADEYIPEGHECEFQEGYSVLGVVLSGRPGRKLTVSGQLLPLTSPVLRQMCEGLGARAVGHSGRPNPRALTNFDLAATDLTEIAVISLVPGQMYGVDFEERTARAYWAGLISNNDPVALGQKILQQYGRHGLDSLLEQLKDKGTVTFTVDAGPNNGWGPVNPLTDEALKTFGSAARDMDGKWSSFLQASNVQVAGQSRAIMAQGRYSRVLTRFRADEMAGERFWSELTYGSDFARSVTCLATMFTVDNDYGSVIDLPGYRRCAATALKAERGQ